MEDNKEIKTEFIEETKVESEKELPNLDELFVKNNTELKEWVINLFTNMNKKEVQKEEPKKKELDNF